MLWRVEKLVAKLLGTSSFRQWLCALVQIMITQLFILMLTATWKVRANHKLLLQLALNVAVNTFLTYSVLFKNSPGQCSQSGLCEMCDAAVCFGHSNELTGPQQGAP